MHVNSTGRVQQLTEIIFIVHTQVLLMCNDYTSMIIHTTALWNES